jgi:Mor family transcriptional regulator
MVTKTRQDKTDMFTQAPNPEALATVPPSEDVVDFTLRCVLAMAPGLSEAIARMADAHVREVFGGDRVYVANRRGEGHSARNAAIRRDYQNGERVELLMRRYQLSSRRIYEILGK